MPGNTESVLLILTKSNVHIETYVINLIFVEISERSVVTRLTDEAELETHRSHIAASSNSITKQKS